MTPQSCSQSYLFLCSPLVGCFGLVFAALLCCRVGSFLFLFSPPRGHVVGGASESFLSFFFFFSTSHALSCLQAAVYSLGTRDAYTCNCVCICVCIMSVDKLFRCFVEIVGWYAHVRTALSYHVQQTDSSYYLRYTPILSYAPARTTASTTPAVYLGKRTAKYAAENICIAGCMYQTTLTDYKT